jgi:DNA-binding response OmpR family regulator
MATLILVEDDQLLGRMIQDELNDRHHTTTWVKTGGELLNHLEHQPPDLIILDIVHDVDGFQIIQKLKQPDSPYQAIPIIVLTNLGQNREIEKAIQLGASDYIVKANIDIDQLHELIQSRLQ